MFTVKSAGYDQHEIKFYSKINKLVRDDSKAFKANEKLKELYCRIWLTK